MTKHKEKYHLNMSQRIRKWNSNLIKHQWEEKKDKKKIQQKKGSLSVNNILEIPCEQ